MGFYILMIATFIAFLAFGPPLLMLYAVLKERAQKREAEKKS